jgi:hypothetical protein
VQAAILGALTNEGWLLKMALATELDVVLLCSPQVITSSSPLEREDVQQSLLAVLAYF